MNAKKNKQIESRMSIFFVQIGEIFFKIKKVTFLEE